MPLGGRPGSKYFLLGYGFDNLTYRAIKIYVDNIEAKIFFKNPSIRSQIKHMKIKYYEQRPQVECDFSKFNFILSKDDAADDFAKVIYSNGI